MRRWRLAAGSHSRDGHLPRPAPSIDHIKLTGSDSSPSRFHSPGLSRVVRGRADKEAISTALILEKGTELEMMPESAWM
jgi:hypothetical protein